MGSNLKDVYYCQQERTQELSDRMYSRNMPSHQLGAAYFARPVDTYATVMPMLDCRKPATVTKAHFPVYNQSNIFNPGQGAPFNGYSRNVDLESRLHNSFAPLQNCAQGKYIPGTKSDMFCNKYLTQNHAPVNMRSHGLLFKEEKFSAFNPNTCNLGHKVFNNFMRQEIKNIDLEEEKPEKAEGVKKVEQ